MSTFRGEDQTFYLWLPKPPFEVLLLYVLDDVPTDAQMACDILNRLRLTQVTSVSLKGFGVGSSVVGERNMNLSNDVAGLAGDSWNWQDNECLARSDWE